MSSASIRLCLELEEGEKPLIFLEDFHSQDFNPHMLRIENPALMRPWGMNCSVPSERLSSSSMDSWPHYRILGAQIVAGSYDLNSNNGLLTRYGSPSDGFLALHHPPHNRPQSLPVRFEPGIHPFI